MESHTNSTKTEVVVDQPRPSDEDRAAQPTLPLVPLDGPADERELAALIEALLLVAPEPPTVAQLAQGAGAAAEAVESALVRLESAENRGWVIQRHKDTIQLATAPRFAGFIRRFLGLDREAKLSTAAVETLAIIAYRQPLTRAEIEAVRGVDCAGVLATLHGRGLIEPVGRLATAGNPFQYGTTPEFLRHFGLGSLTDLPPLGEIDGRDARTALDAAVAATEFATAPAEAPTPGDDTALME